ncbi:hypothetical protein ACQEVC_39045 [Plantactinospora sp. CA-294935]
MGVSIIDRTVAELARPHPLSNVPDALFRLYACRPGDGAAVRVEAAR